MARGIRKSIKCSKCGYFLQILVPERTEYGCPLRKCPHCGHINYDGYIKEIGLMPVKEYKAGRRKYIMTYSFFAAALIFASAAIILTKFISMKISLLLGLVIFGIVEIQLIKRTAFNLENPVVQKSFKRLENIEYLNELQRHGVIVSETSLFKVYGDKEEIIPNKDVFVYYEIPEDYDYIPSRLKTLLGEECRQEWVQVTLNVVTDDSGKELFDYPKTVEEVCWALVNKAPKVEVFETISKSPKRQNPRQSFPTERVSFIEHFREFRMNTWLDNCCIFYEDENSQVQRIYYFCQGEQIDIFIKSEELDEIKGILGKFAREITLKEYETYGMYDEE